jgi:hypothetical protein
MTIKARTDDNEKKETLLETNTESNRKPGNVIE